MHILLNILLSLILIYFVVSTLFLVVFSLAAFFYKTVNLEVESLKNRFAILIPSYQEDNVIKESSLSAINQDFEKDKFDVFVIADGMKEETNKYLESIGVNVIRVKFENSSKAASLKYASKQIHGYDYVVVIDADNVIPKDYLENINSFSNRTKCIALQTHRQSKGITNNISYIDSVIEEMNNSIYRQGHSALGISSALIGSGMIFNYKWFIKNIIKVHGAGEDKEIEELLLKQKIHICYSKEITFMDEKINSKKNMFSQRRRWVAAQYSLFCVLIKRLPKAFIEKNIDYIIKTIETITLPKILLLGNISFFAFFLYFISPVCSIILCTLFVSLIISLYLAIPYKLRDRRLLVSIRNIPYLFMMMLCNLFRIKGTNNSFIHTKHGE